MSAQPTLVVPRLVVLLSLGPQSDRGEAERTLHRGAASLRLCTQADGGIVRAAVQIAADPLAAMLAQRGRPAPVDAVVEVTLRGDRPLDQLIDVGRQIGQELRGLVEATASAVLAGLAHLIVAGGGPIFLALAGRKDPATTVDEMRRWWLGQHAALVQRVVRPLPNGYEQLHVDRSLSRQAARAVGFAEEAYDAFDSINAGSVETLLQPLQDPEIAGALYQDELGHLDHGSFRGALCKVLE